MHSKTLAINKKSGRAIDQVRELPSDPSVDWLWEELPDTYWDPSDEPPNEEWDVAIHDRQPPEIPMTEKSQN